MKNVEELISNLSNVFDDLKSGKIQAKDADSLANIAGKMINASKVQVEYYSLRKESPTIEFLHTSVAKRIKSGVVEKDHTAGVVRHTLGD